MPLKAVLVASTPTAAIILGPLGIQGNTNIAKLSKQSVKQYRKIITQLTDNQAALKKQLNR